MAPDPAGPADDGRRAGARGMLRAATPAVLRRQWRRLNDRFDRRVGGARLERDAGGSPAGGDLRSAVSELQSVVRALGSAVEQLQGDVRSIGAEVERIAAEQDRKYIDLDRTIPALVRSAALQQADSRRRIRAITEERRVLAEELSQRISRLEDGAAPPAGITTPDPAPADR